jgi:hypothetical protein
VQVEEVVEEVLVSCVSRVGRLVSGLVVAVACLLAGCASGPDPGTQPEDLHDVAPGEYRLTAEAFPVLPETIWLEPETETRSDWLCIGEMKPHLPENHRFHLLAKWGVKPDGTLHLVWANDYSGIRVELTRVSKCTWGGFVTSFWDFTTRPQSQFPARLECLGG